MKEKLNQKIGLILEYYTAIYQEGKVKDILEKIQNIYDYRDPEPEEVRPLLSELYFYIVKREFHSELLEKVLKELENS